MDPLSAIIALVPLVVTTIDGAEKLIARIQDHARTLQQSIDDGDAADKSLNAATATPATT